MSRFVVVLMVVLLGVSVFSASASPVQAAAYDYRVLPVDGRLVVNVFFFDVSPELFGAKNVQNLLEQVSDTGLIRGVAKSQVAAFGDDDNFYPFEFEVFLRFIIPEAEVVNEYRELMRSSLSQTPYQISQKAVEFALAHEIPLSWVDRTIEAREALEVFAFLTQKHYPEIEGDHVIFVFCSTPLLGNRPVIYYTFGRSPDSERYLADFGISIFGGPWWGRYYYVDVCSLPHPQLRREIKPITSVTPVEERVTYLASLIDKLIDQNFVKSTLFEPKYRVQSLIDVVVIDATVAGVAFDVIVRYFDPELLAKAYRTLMPYNQYNVRLKKVDLAGLPEISAAIQYTLDGIILRDNTAYRILRQKGVLEQPSDANYVYMPVIVLFTTTNSFVEKPGILGRVVPDSDDPNKPLFASAAVYYEEMLEEGLTVNVAHVTSLAFGLRHPHDDYDEFRRAESEFLPLTYFTETILSFSSSWSSAIEKRQLFSDVYAMRSFWSIFDLDNIDRATITLLLKGYEENVDVISETLRSNGVDVKDVPEVEQVLTVANQLARASVEEFKKHNYFNRVTFRGLGAQLETSFDYAFAAWLYTENLKNLYLPALVQVQTAYGRQRAELEKTLERMRADAEEAKRLLEESRRKLEEKNEELRRLNEGVNALRGEVSVAEQSVAKVREARQEVAELEKNLAEVSGEVASYGREVERLRNEFNTLASVAVVAAALGVGLTLFSRRLFPGRKLPPPPPPPG